MGIACFSGVCRIVDVASNFISGDFPSLRYAGMDLLRLHTPPSLPPILRYPATGYATGIMYILISKYVYIVSK